MKSGHRARLLRAGAGGATQLAGAASQPSLALSHLTTRVSWLPDGGPGVVQTNGWRLSIDDSWRCPQVIILKWQQLQVYPSFPEALLHIKSNIWYDR